MRKRLSDIPARNEKGNHSKHARVSATFGLARKFAKSCANPRGNCCKSPNSSGPLGVSLYPLPRQFPRLGASGTATTAPALFLPFPRHWTGNSLGGEGTAKHCTKGGQKQFRTDWPGSCNSQAASGRRHIGAISGGILSKPHSASAPKTPGLAAQIVSKNRAP